jgi:hypothetical protein
LYQEVYVVTAMPAMVEVEGRATDSSNAFLIKPLPVERSRCEPLEVSDRMRHGVVAESTLAIASAAALFERYNFLEVARAAKNETLLAACA